MFLFCCEQAGLCNPRSLDLLAARLANAFPRHKPGGGNASQQGTAAHCHRYRRRPRLRVRAASRRPYRLLGRGRPATRRRGRLRYRGGAVSRFTPPNTNTARPPPPERRSPLRRVPARRPRNPPLFSILQFRLLDRVLPLAPALRARRHVGLRPVPGHQ